MLDWKASTLGKVCNKRNEQVQPDNFSDVYVGLEHIESRNPKLTTFGDTATVRSAKSKFYPSDVLYGKLRPYLDKAALADIEGMCSTDILVLKADKELTAPEYLVFLIHTKPFIDHAIKTTSGVNHPRTSWNSISLFKFTLPPLPEQRTIAAVLAKIQEAIAAQQEIIDQTGELKKALMNKLFKEGLRGEPTKETEVGPIPESWEFSTLGKLCNESGGRIQTGPFGSQLHSHEYEESGLPVVNPTHMLGNRINHQNIPKISIETAARLTRHELREGDILFARRGVIGRHGLVGKDEVGWICGTGCFLVRLNSERIINKFLSFFIATQPVVAWLNANAAGAIMLNLNSQVIGRIPVYFPPKSEQEKIVTLLTGLDDKVDAAEVKKEVLQDLFKTMLHELMTGNIRTTPLMEA